MWVISVFQKLRTWKSVWVGSKVSQMLENSQLPITLIVEAVLFTSDNAWNCQIQNLLSTPFSRPFKERKWKCPPSPLHKGNQWKSFQGMLYGYVTSLSWYIINFDNPCFWARNYAEVRKSRIFVYSLLVETIRLLELRARPTTHSWFSHYLSVKPTHNGWRYLDLMLIIVHKKLITLVDHCKNPHSRNPSSISLRKCDTR